MGSGLPVRRCQTSEGFAIQGLLEFVPFVGDARVTIIGGYDYFFY